MKLEGKKAVITGASRGLGKVIAEEFLKEGADIVICASNKGQLDETRIELSLKYEKHEVYAIQCDISDTNDLRFLYSESKDILGDINILVNNAGIQGTKGKIEDVSWYDWVDTINTNLLGTVYLCKLFIPHFKNNNYGKIINLSGGGSANPRPYFSSYAVSKVGVVRFSETIAEELKGSGVDVNCVSPGALNTRMLDEVLEAGVSKIGEDYYLKALEQKRLGGSSLENAAKLCVFLASKESDGITGKLISAVWDDWKDLVNHIDILKENDIYTLRRILPSDRHFNWGNVE